jgi:hypothetical protein
MPSQVTPSSDLFNIGALCFGVVIGWVTYRTLRRTNDVGLSDIGTVIGAVGGGAVLGIFERGDSFAWYAIGLAGGFFFYLVINLILDPGGTKDWMGGGEPLGPGPHDPGTPIDRRVGG